MILIGFGVCELGGWWWIWLHCGMKKAVDTKSIHWKICKALYSTWKIVIKHEICFSIS